MVDDNDTTLVKRIDKLNGRSVFKTTLLLLIFLLGVPSISSGQTISNVLIDESTFSPDGDGIQDSTTIWYELSDTVFSFYAIVMTGDTLNTLDTLIAGNPRSSGIDSTSWDGGDSLGIVVPEGHYLIYLRAEFESSVDSIYKKVKVDLTPTQVEITSIEPSTLVIPGPGQPTIRIYYDISDSPPSDSVEVGVFIFAPGSAFLDTLITLVHDFLEPGSYSANWNGAAVKDGIHKVKVVAYDDGGHSDYAIAELNVDIKPPTIEITSPEPDKSFRVIPDSIRGWAYDRNQVTSLQIKYNADFPYLDVPTQWVQNDTVYFVAPLADSIIEERDYVLRFKAVDAPGRADSLPFRVELDLTPPPTPILDPPEGPVRTPYYTLTGTFDLALGEYVKVYRNGAFLDSVFVLSGDFNSVEVALIPGENIFTVVALDVLGNASPHSNAVTVQFDASKGVFISQPFRPEDEFQINLLKQALYTELKIYDLGGDLVVTLEDRTHDKNIAIEWDGLNGNREALKRGPLVVVVQVNYAGGGKETFREIFLFDP